MAKRRVDLSNVNFDEVIAWYKLHSKASCMEKFNLTSQGFDNILRDKHYKKSKEDAWATRLNTFREKYGVDNPWQIEEVKEKCNTKDAIEKANATRIKTCQEQYGVNSYWQAKECREKARQTCLDRYSNATYNNVEKAKQTCIEKYGVDSYTKTEECKQRYADSCVEKYGVTTALLSKEIKEKIKQTNLEKYGVENVFAAEEIKEKIKQTCNEKYGVDWYTQTKEYAQTAVKKYIYTNVSFDSSWELAIWIYAKDHNEEIVYHPTTIRYSFNDKDHFYTPDFYYLGKLIEVKGNHLLTEDNKLYDIYSENQDKAIAKQKCMDENNVIIWGENEVLFALNYVSMTYGRKYLQQFRKTIK